MPSDGGRSAHLPRIALALWGKEKALELLGEAGFPNVAVHQLPHDAQNHYYVVTKR